MKWIKSALLFAAVILSQSALLWGSQCELSLEKVLKRPGFGPRGFMGAWPVATAENEPIAMAAGASHWATKIYVVPTVGAAQAHADLQGNIPLKGIYIVIPGLNLNTVYPMSPDRISPESVKALFRAHISDPNVAVYSPDVTKIDLKTYSPGSKFKVAEGDFKKALTRAGIVDDGHILSPIEQRNVQLALYSLKPNLKASSSVPLIRLSSTDVDVIREGADRIELRAEEDRGAITTDGKIGTSEYMFYLKGWTAVPFRGVVMLEDTRSEKSSTFREVRKRMTAYVKAGGRYIRNENFAQVVDMLRDQKRSTAHILTGVPIPLDPTSNRFLTDFDNIKAEFLKSYKLGHMGSYEKRDANGRLIAASIYQRKGNLIYAETVVYTPEAGIDAAKEVFLAMADDLYAAGIKVVDLIMVTPFSASIKGRYIPSADFEYLAMPLRNQEPSVLLGTGIWSPSH